MVRRDAAFLKAERIGVIQKIIMQNIDKGVNVEMLLREVEYSIGLNQETALRYVDVIIGRQGWLIVDGKIVASLGEEVK